MPIVGADLEGLRRAAAQRETATTTGLEGIAVYNPAAVGGAGVNLALKALNGETVETTT